MTTNRQALVLLGLLFLCAAASLAHGQGAVGQAGGPPAVSRTELRECLVTQYQNQAAEGALNAQRAELKTAESRLVSYGDVIDSRRVTLDKRSQVAVDAFNADVARFREVAAQQEAAVASFRERAARYNEKLDAWNTRCAGREYRDRDRVAVESEIAEASTRAPKKFTYGGDNSHATSPATVLELQRGAQAPEAFVTRSLPPKAAAVAPSTEQTDIKDDLLADTLYSSWFKSDDEVAYKAAKEFIAIFPGDVRARAVRLWMSRNQALEHSAESGTPPNSAGATAAGANAIGVHDVPNQRNTFSEQQPQNAVGAESQRRTELYTTWESNRKDNHVVAYNAGKEFVAANQSDPRTPIIRSWIKSYEKVAGSTVAAQPLTRGMTDAGLLEETKQWLTQFLESQGSFEFASKSSSGGARKGEQKLIGARFEGCNLIRSDATQYYRSGLFTPAALFVRTESIPFDLVDAKTISYVPPESEMPSGFSLSLPYLKVTIVGNEKLVIGSWHPHTGTLDSPVPSKTAPSQPYTTNFSFFPINASEQVALLNALRTLVRLCTR